MVDFQLRTESGLSLVRQSPTRDSQAEMGHAIEAPFMKRTSNLSSRAILSQRHAR